MSVRSEARCAAHLATDEGTDGKDGKDSRTRLERVLEAGLRARESQPTAMLGMVTPRNTNPFQVDNMTPRVVPQPSFHEVDMERNVTRPSERRGSEARGRLKKLLERARELEYEEYKPLVVELGSLNTFGFVTLKRDEITGSVDPVVTVTDGPEEFQDSVWHMRGKSGEEKAWKVELKDGSVLTPEYEGEAVVRIHAMYPDSSGVDFEYNRTMDTWTVKNSGNANAGRKSLLWDILSMFGWTLFTSAMFFATYDTAEEASAAERRERMRKLMEAARDEREFDEIEKAHAEEAEKARRQAYNREVAKKQSEMRELERIRREAEAYARQRAAEEDRARREAAEEAERARREAEEREAKERFERDLREKAEEAARARRKREAEAREAEKRFARQQAERARIQAEAREAEAKSRFEAERAKFLAKEEEEKLNQVRSIKKYIYDSKERYIVPYLDENDRNLLDWYNRRYTHEEQRSHNMPQSNKIVY